MCLSMRTIKYALTNCGFLYDSNNLTYLCFHDLIETKDKNSELRKVFWNFYKKIPEYKKDKNKCYETFFNYYSERFNFNFNIVKNTDSYFEK